MSRPITDTDLVDALEAGLMAYASDTLTPAGWVREWVCCYDVDRVTIASTFREAAQLALLDRQERGLNPLH